MKKYWPLAVLVFANLIVGLMILPGFGESMDELSQRSYAQRTVQAVQSLVSTGIWPAYFFQEDPKQGSHGPAFMILVTLLKDLFLPNGTGVEKLQFSHFLYFLVFQVGTVSLFFLARRWMNEMAAFGTALLFCTQPLLVGHAFMNPKDVVFMSLLIAGAALALKMVDGEEKRVDPAPHGICSFLQPFLRGDVWLAGLLLGFASAIRMAAPLIAILVLGYILSLRKWQALPRFFAYGCIAFFFMILFWPYLWPDPLRRLIESAGYSAHYPDVHLTLFDGTLFDSPDIPRSYLPFLVVVQLTETTVLLVFLGVISTLRKFRPDLVVLIAIWFVLPAAAIIALRVNLYNNFRQVLFIIPPLFLLAGLGLEWLFTVLRRPAARVLMLSLILLPGIYANISLYPYQYVYYNQLAGGLHGAYRVFELDYWNLAYREAQSYINKHAGHSANIFVGDSKPSAQTFSRHDLVFNAFGARRKNWRKYDYIIVSTAENDDEKFSGLRTVFVVERFGVPLVYVKKPD